MDPARATHRELGIPLPVSAADFVVESSGQGDGPAEALVPHLLARGAASVTTIRHPLAPETNPGHRIDVHSGDGSTVHRSYRAPHHPPSTFLLDPFLPFVPPRATAWFGFNCLATARGLVARRLRRVARVVHWSVDFSPNRFGSGVTTRAYEALDEYCCRHADARVDLSEAALSARNAQYHLDRGCAAPAVVIPMGAWLARTPKAGSSNATARRVVFLGHLVPRMGAVQLVRALIELRERGERFDADIIGGGPEEDEIRRLVSTSGLTSFVRVHGFVPDHHEVERLIAGATVAVAPYVDDPASYTRFADPGKLKAYLGAGVPVVLTPVPPNTAELERFAGALIVESSPRALADGIDRVLNEGGEAWHDRHRAAMDYAMRFDWEVILDQSLPMLGFDPGVTAPDGRG
jgi:glycosyltransferase involved in cell wall biosynthesis